MISCEQQARDMLVRMGYQSAEWATAGDVAELANLINNMSRFKVNVAYMPVPRCDGCKYWRLYENPVLDTASNALGHCVQPNPTWNEELYTRHDFGCVQWEAK